MDPLLAAATLRPLDWAILAAYFILLAFTGWWFSRVKHKTTEDYFLGGRSMPVWAVAISILATAQSAATFVGVPESAYAGDLTYLSTNIGGLIAAVIIAGVFIPAYYRHNVSTPYQLLERRFGPGAKLATSWAYMIGRVFASGARVYVGAIPVSLAIFGDIDPGHLAISIAAFMAFGIVYTLAGGIASVIWTDVFQVCVYLGAAVVAAILLWRAIPADATQILSALSTGMPDGSSKLTLVRPGLDFSKAKLGFDLSAEFTLITAVTGWMLITIASHGTDQDLVQRMLTCKNAAKGGRSVITGILVGIPTVLLFATLGLLLWVYYNRPELAGGVHSPATIDGAQVFLRYILTEMPPGAAGLMIAGVMAAGPAGINASLNSMSSTFVGDVYRPARPGRPDRHYLQVGRLATIAWGIILGLFAMLCILWQQQSQEKVLPFVLGVMAFAYAGLLGVFLTALFTRRGNTASAITALITGFLIVLLLQPVILSAITAGSPLESLKLASPWRLVIGTAIATLVCCAGRPRTVIPAHAS
ncbi:MAG: sodium:solute symporter [Phycisphaerales bacterium]|nr:sodium:solute symporter [Phycisphaerales bacterium]